MADSHYEISLGKKPQLYGIVGLAVTALMIRYERKNDVQWETVIIDDQKGKASATASKPSTYYYVQRYPL